jgi:competence ComEA-like helix-hairpin-helix protein
MKNKLAQFFQLSPSDRRGAYVLAVLILLIFLVRSIPSKTYFVAVDVHAFDTLDMVIKPEEPLVEGPELQINQTFDPNYLTARKMYQMGFRKTWVRAIFEYKEEQGFIHSKDELKALLSIPETEWLQLEPWIQFNSKARPISKKLSDFQASPRTSIELEINTSTSEEFAKIKGIGSVLSARIVKYRDALGGFYSTNQLYEVYGLDSTVVRSIKEHSVKLSTYQMFRLDTCSLEFLKAHPYVSKHQAKTLLAFVKQHGQIQEKDLTRIHGWDALTINKLKPYLLF